MKRKFDLTSIIALLVALFFWSIGPVIIRYLTDYFDFWSQNFYRFTAASFCWLPIVIHAVYKKKFDHRIWKLAIPPAIVWTLMQSCWANSLYHINPAFSTLIAKSQIIWASILVLFFLPEERFLFKSKRFWTGLMCAISGLLGVVLTSDAFEYSATAKGIVLVSVFSVSMACYTVYLKRFFNETNPFHTIAIIMLYATVLLFILAALFGEPFENLPKTPKPWLAVILSSFTAISLSNSLYLFAVKRIGATIPIIVILLQPFTVLVFSHLAFGETMSMVQVVFGVLLISGGFTASLAQTKKPMPAVVQAVAQESIDESEIPDNEN